MIDRVYSTHLPQIVFGRLHVASIIHCARLQEQLAPIPIELVVESGERLFPDRPVQTSRSPVATAVERNIDARDLAATGPGKPREHGKSALLVERRLWARVRN